MSNKKLEDYYVLLALDEATAMRVRTIKTLQKDFNMPYRLFIHTLLLLTTLSLKRKN